MSTHVQKWANSLTIRIPKVFAAEVGREPGIPGEG
jgi:antitoxin component of MazEF toxin-antitoxin module